MRITKKVSAIVAVAALSAAGLAGCGAEEKKADPAPSAAPSAEAPKADGEKVVIKYLHRLPDGDGMVKVADAAAKFNAENPDVEVQVEKFDGKAQESYAKINQLVKAGEPAKGYCLAQIGYGEVASEYVAGDLEDVSAEAAQYKDNFYPGAMGMMTLGDVVVGLPQDIGPLVYTYDKDEFDALGIQPPKTWDEFMEAAKKAKEKGKFIATWQGDETQYRMSGLAASNGATWFSAEGDKWKIDANGEKTAQVAEKVQAMLDQDLMLKIDRWGDDWKVAMKDKKIIGTIAAGWEPGFMLGDLGVEKANWQVTRIPTVSGEEMTGSDGGSGIGVLKGCSNKEAALKFANWYNTNVDDLASQGLVIATNKGTPKTPDAVKALWGGQDVMAELGNLAQKMNPNFPYLPTWPAVGKAMGEEGGKVSAGGAKVADVFKTAQDTAVKSMKDAGLPVAE
ncbi:hypothetical protein BK816_07405 [Boudabousia tangfeifanii]|uniref:ABC transporter substrate-binding protein n=1 Tax=Boudabousia tangfeifanii TaxID=1912795 RepID=A0A1D9MLF9_9ACTO|nr:extracellular solute-binding protein [Boudabousia tangfeifanii]AOZ73137.1 hypothetical protein BK816_07405 [Boudabousia tangfeifanii]